MVIGTRKFSEAVGLIKLQIAGFGASKPTDEGRTEAEKSAYRRLTVVCEQFERLAGDETDSSDRTDAAFNALLGELRSIVDEEKDTHIIESWGGFKKNPIKVSPPICGTRIKSLLEELPKILSQSDDVVPAASAAAGGAVQGADLVRLKREIKDEMRGEVKRQVREEMGEAANILVQVDLTSLPSSQLARLAGILGTSEQKLLGGPAAGAAGGAAGFWTGSKPLPDKYPIAVIPARGEREAWLQESAQNPIHLAKKMLSDCVPPVVLRAVWKLEEFKKTLLLPAGASAAASPALFGREEARQQITLIDELIYTFIFSTLVEPDKYSSQAWAEKVDTLIDSKLALIEGSGSLIISVALHGILDKIKCWKNSDEMPNAPGQAEPLLLDTRFQVIYNAVKTSNWLPKNEMAEEALQHKKNSLKLSGKAELDGLD